MHKVNFEEDDLPFEDLEAMGLAASGKLLLNIDDLKTLLSGRRTRIMTFEDLESENIKIKELQAKLSLRKNEKGKVDLVIHPVYCTPVKPEFLDINEARQLEKGEVANFLKITKDDKGNTKEYLVEYDAETRAFIISDTKKILAPDMVNGEFLTAAQKEKYRKGKEVELPDGTKFAYSAADKHGIRSNKIALVASIMIDGGLTYIVFRGLNALFNQKRDPEDARKLSPGYYNAAADAEDQRAERVTNANEHYRTKTGR